MIEVKNVRQFSDKGNLKAFFTVVIDGVEIRDCRVIQQPGQDAFATLPQTSYKNKDGETKYYNIIQLPDNIYNLFKKVTELPDIKNVIDSKQQSNTGGLFDNHQTPATTSRNDDIPF